MLNPAPVPLLPASAIRIDAATGSGVGGYLRAYSSFEPYELSDYVAAMRRDLPDIAIEIFRMPTASLTEHLMAGASADLIIGWADTAARSKGIADLVTQPGLPISAGADGFCRPTGFSVAFVTDPAGIFDRGAVMPASWGALADPKFRNGVVFPDPRRSGAGYLALTTIIQAFGPDAGWDLMRDIDKNVIDYPGSSWEPAARIGENGAVVGVTVRIAATRRVNEKPVLAIALPLDAVGAEAEVYGILRSTRHRAAAERVLAWLVSSAATPHFYRHGKVDLSATHREDLFEIDADRATCDREVLLRRFSQLTRKNGASNTTRSM